MKFLSKISPHKIQNLLAVKSYLGNSIFQMNLEGQIRLHKELSRKIEEMEEEKRALGMGILEQMQTKTLKIPGFIVRRCSRLSIKLSIDEARSLNAVKFEETVDKEKIKTLHSEGQAIKGVSEIQYIQISNLAHDQIPEN